MGELDRVPAKLKPAFHWAWTLMMTTAVLAAVGLAIFR
jgi:hypothetical protein